jgi:hypothetical protein
MAKRIRQAYQFTLHPALADALDQYVEQMAARGATIRRSDLVNAGLAAFFEAGEADRERLLQRGRSVLTGEVEQLLNRPTTGTDQAPNRKRAIARAADRVRKSRGGQRKTAS